MVDPPCKQTDVISAQLSYIDLRLSNVCHALGHYEAETRLCKDTCHQGSHWHLLLAYRMYEGCIQIMPEARDIVSNTSIPAGAASDQPWQRGPSDDGLLEHEEECSVALPVTGTEKSQE